VDTVKIFKTALGRPVHAGGGIIPDIIVEEKINWSDPMHKRWMDIISEYAIRYNLEHHDGIILPTSRMSEVRKQLPTTAEMLEGITKFAHVRAMDDLPAILQFLSDHQQDLIRITEATVIAYRTGEAGWYIAFNSSDPVVRKAMEMIHLDLLMALKQN
jgi:hypothetical protein